MHYVVCHVYHTVASYEFRLLSARTLAGIWLEEVAEIKILKNCSMLRDTYNAQKNASRIYLGLYTYSYNETAAELGKGEGRRKTGNNCSKLSYYIFTRNHSATLILQPEGICESSNFSSVTVSIKVKSCPRGFEQIDDQCECDKRLSNRFKGIVCDVNADTITTKGSTTWLNLL